MEESQFNDALQTREDYEKSEEILDAIKTDLNDIFKGYCTLETHLKNIPDLLEIDGKDQYCNSPEIQNSADSVRLQIQKDGRDNDPHGLLYDLRLRSSPICIEYFFTDYATITTLRRNNDLPKIISASAVVHCDPLREIVLHIRNKHSSTYPECLHTLGGAFKPKIKDKNFALYDKNIAMTAIREIMEESGLAIQWQPNMPLWWLHEERTGFRQMFVAGAPVTKANIEIMEPSWEGHLIRLSFDDLADAILLRGAFRHEGPSSQPLKWTPTGLLSVLLWVANITPDRDIKFNGSSPSQFFFEMIKELKIQGIENLLGTEKRE
ncbi:MAG: hypothetical protein HQM03_12890 [Magnetococcales bacterium]|nr:hypothetical protein [Magnetococcales bacterium]